MTLGTPRGWRTRGRRWRVADRFKIVRQAETALGELELSCTTHADKNRCAQVRRAMVALDEEQMAAKGAVANLLDSLDCGYTVPEVIEDLKALVKRWDSESLAAAKAMGKAAG
jgi:hypothetical protein